MSTPETGTVSGGDVSPSPAKAWTRDRVDLRRRLTRWIAARVADPGGGEPRVSQLVAPESNGMSSETVLFDATWHQGGRDRTQRCAARLAPDPQAVPVFPVYDMERQFKVMRLVRRSSTIPVPEAMWYEADEEFLGSPFFVMQRVDGLVPPDVMPYPCGSWLSEASLADQQRVQDAAVRVLVELHAMKTAPGAIDFLEFDRPGDSALRRHVADQIAYYEWVVSDEARSPLIERALCWLEDHWPAEEGPSVLSWGDARIGNMMFQDFSPVAVLDWEMAGVGPREIDLGWMIFLHRFLDDVALQFGLPGMRHFMRLDEVVATYEAMSGYRPRDMEFFTLYAAVRHAVIMSRIARRQVQFGEIACPDDPDDMIMHRTTLEKMLDGAYWSTI